MLESVEGRRISSLKAGMTIDSKGGFGMDGYTARSGGKASRPLESLSTRLSGTFAGDVDPDDLLLRGDRRLVQVEIWIGALHPRLDLRLLPPSPVHVDFLCPLGRLGEDDDPRREHLRESPGDREVALHAPLPVLQLADGQRR